MEKDDGAQVRVCIQILRQPQVLRRACPRLVKLASRVQANEVPAGAVEAVVIGHVIPIVKIAGGHPVLVFMVANGWVRDGPEVSIETGGGGETIPIVKL